MTAPNHDDTSQWYPPAPTLPSSPRKQRTGCQNLLTRVTEFFTRMTKGAENWALYAILSQLDAYNQLYEACLCILKSLRDRGISTNYQEVLFVATPPGTRERPHPSTASQMPTWGCFHRLEPVLKNFTDGFYCCNMTCKAMTEMSGASFQICSYCKVMRFCSEKCQVEACKLAKHPHRDLGWYMNMRRRLARGMYLFFCRTGITAELVNIAGFSGAYDMNPLWQVQNTLWDLLTERHTYASARLGLPAPPTDAHITTVA